MTQRRTKARRKAQGGWTLIEVMMAMAILIAGSAGILAMQQAATDGNLEARQMTTATAIARIWVERLKRDTLMWTVGGNHGATDAILTQTLYLQAVPPPATAPVWGTPNPPDLTVESYAYDYQGREVLPASATTTYCVQDRFQWLPNSAAGGTVGGNTMRADVRVWWRRRGRENVYNPYPACGVGSEAIIGADPTVHTLTTSVVLHWTRRQ